MEIMQLVKSEIRISKSETNSNDQNPNIRNVKAQKLKPEVSQSVGIVLNFRHLKFDIVSNFDIRISSLCGLADFFCQKKYESHN